MSACVLYMFICVCMYADLIFIYDSFRFYVTAGLVYIHLDTLLYCYATLK